MNCPHCGSNQLSVVNSRPTMNSSQIWRRRKCLTCQEVFTTYERMNLSHLTVVKKSGKRQKFKREKLFSGIYHSAIDKKNADRGEVSEFTSSILLQIEQEILKLKKKEIETREITNIVLEILKKKSPDTFLRYLAYREGNDGKNMKKLLKEYF